MLKLDKLRNVISLPGKKSEVAIIDGEKRMTWGELENHARALAAYFGPKDYRRVVFLSENRMDLIPLFSAFSSLGIPFIGIDYAALHDEKIHCLREIEASCLIYGASFRTEAEALCKETGIQGWCIETDLGRVREGDGYVPAPRPFESIMFTSGTTGLPKGVYRTKSFEERRFADVSARFGFGTETFIATIPFFHGSVTGWARLFLSLGGKLVLTDVADPGKLHRDVLEHHVTCMLASPPVLDDFVSRTAVFREGLALKFVIVGGKVFPVALKRRALEVLGPIVNEYYGTSETGMNVIGTAEDLRDFPQSSGRVMAGSDIAILDSSGKRLPDGEVGRVAIESYQNMEGYFNKRPADFVPLGDRRYVLTADCGYLNGDRLFLLNRTFGVRTDFNLYAIENAFRAVSGVRDVFTVAVDPHTIDAFVAGGETLDKASLAVQTRELARYYNVEIRVRFVPRIPYGSSGKVRLRDLIPAVPAPNSERAYANGGGNTGVVRR